MAVTLDNYLNILDILINEIFGSVILFIIVGAVVIAYICVKNDIPLVASIAMLCIWCLLVLTLYYNMFILGLILIVIGLIIASNYNDILRKQNN